MTEEYVFQSPFVQVWAKAPMGGALLENAKIQQLGARAFIVGTLSAEKGSQDARHGLVYWISLEEVLSFTEYPNRDRVDKYAAQYKERHPEPARKRRWFS